MSLLQDVPLSDEASATTPPVRVAYFVSHPIQYQAPLLRRLANEPGVDLTTFFFSDVSIRGYSDEGFGGLKVSWDVPLLDGYKHEFLPAVHDNGSLSFKRPLNYGVLSRLRRGNFQAVWLHGYHTINHLHVLLAARILGIPVILRAESMLYDRERSRPKLAAKKLFFSLLRKTIRCVAPIGKANAEYWRRYLGPDVPMFPMPYAVDNDFFRSRALEASLRRESFRKELGLEAGRPIFLFASKLQDRKRCMDLVEAFLRLSSKVGGESAAYLLIVGEGPERAALERRIRDCELASVLMLGFKNQSELPRYFDLCDAFVLPSIHEPWGLIVNEVMNAGRPVVVSDQVGCRPDLIHDGVNGFVFPARDVEALACILRSILEQPALAKAAGQRAMESISRWSFEEDAQGLRRALAFCIPSFAG